MFYLFGDRHLGIRCLRLSSISRRFDQVKSEPPLYSAVNRKVNPQTGYMLQIARLF